MRAIGRQNVNRLIIKGEKKSAGNHGAETIGMLTQFPERDDEWMKTVCAECRNRYAEGARKPCAECIHGEEVEEWTERNGGSKDGHAGIARMGLSRKDVTVVVPDWL